MINFTVGPVQASSDIRHIAGEDVPYFRTSEFSEIMLQNEALVKKFANAPKGSRGVFITGSGTAGMEAAVMNTLKAGRDKVLVINGGSFGERFVEICRFHHIDCTEIKLPFGQGVRKEDLDPFEGQGYTALLVNKNETSSGVHFDCDLLGQFCRKNNLFFIVDAVSSFLADEIDMAKQSIDIMITGSQKALSCAPGISLLVLSPAALHRVTETTSASYYLDLKAALKNGERGQTPFTPAVSILLQIHARLTGIEKDGGVRSEIKKIQELARYFRERVKDYPFDFVCETMSNAVTALHPTTIKATELFRLMKDEYHIWICPNGGEHKDDVFRIGHLGHLTKEDYDRLFVAFDDLKKRHLI